MSDQVIIALLGFASSLVAAVFGLWNNMLARKNSVDLRETKTAMITLEKQTNSIKDALVKATGEAEFHKGVQAGVREGPTAEKPAS